MVPGTCENVLYGRMNPVNPAGSEWKRPTSDARVLAEVPAFWRKIGILGRRQLPGDAG